MYNFNCHDLTEIESKQKLNIYKRESFLYISKGARNYCIFSYQSMQTFSKKSRGNGTIPIRQEHEPLYCVGY